MKNKNLPTSAQVENENPIFTLDFFFIRSPKITLKLQNFQN